jgi:hypothetical protein
MEDEEAGKGEATTAWEGKKSLAEKTGEIRGAVERDVALTRSCAGQQNLRSILFSVSTRVTMQV